MTWLCTELNQSAVKGHILELTEVWTRYCQLCRDTEDEVPLSFISRRSSFKEKLKHILGNVFEYHVLDRDDDCENRTVMVLTQFSHIPIANIIEPQTKTPKNV